MKVFKHVAGILLLAIFTALAIGSGGQQASTVREPGVQAQAQQLQDSQVPVQQQGSVLWIGEGGKGSSIAILAPKASGLGADQDYIPLLVQGEFVSNFSGYSAISVLDRLRLDEQYAELLSGYYSDDAEEGWDLGHLSPTDYIMGGSITRTTSGYAMQIGITQSSDKITVASYSETFAFAELDDLSGVRRASLDLLEKMGVIPTERTKTELTRAATENHANAQVALAYGIIAQQQGGEIAALNHFLHAAALDPMLTEASARSSIISANINTGNIGADARAAVAWRSQWVARLTETEEHFLAMFKNAGNWFTLLYAPNSISKGDINWQRETMPLSIPMNLRINPAWVSTLNSAAQTVQAVYDAFNATGQRSTWQLSNWPNESVTNNNIFGEYANWQDNFTVVFELLNDQNKVIGTRTIRVESYGNFSPLTFRIYRGGNNNNQILVRYTNNNSGTVTFDNVSVHDISDDLTIRVASVNGAAPSNAQFSIAAVNFIKLYTESDAMPITRGTRWATTLQAGDSHFYSVNVSANNTTLKGYTTGSDFIAYMWLYDVNGVELEGLPMWLYGNDREISRAVSAGTYYFRVTGHENKGGSYTMVLE